MHIIFFKLFFILTVINNWNSLPPNVVICILFAGTLNSLKSFLGKYRKQNIVIYIYGTRTSVADENKPGQYNVEHNNDIIDINQKRVLTCKRLKCLRAVITNMLIVLGSGSQNLNFTTAI